MSTPYAYEKLTDVEDSAPKFGFGELGEARFADGLEVLVFDPQHEGDVELLHGWWSD